MSGKLSEVVKTTTKTPTELIGLFYKQANELLGFVSELNTYVADLSSSNPIISDPLLMIARAGLSALPEHTQEYVMRVFCVRSSSHIDHIKKREVEEISAISSALFPEVPDSLIDAVKKLATSEFVETDSINDIFDIIDSMARMSIRWVAVKHAVGELSSLTVDDIDKIEKAAELYGLC